MLSRFTEISTITLNEVHTIALTIISITVANDSEFLKYCSFLLSLNENIIAMKAMIRPSKPINDSIIVCTKSLSSEENRLKCNSANVISAALTRATIVSIG